jgi:hypothetical protein
VVPIPSSTPRWLLPGARLVPVDQPGAGRQALRLLLRKRKRRPGATERTVVLVPEVLGAGPEEAVGEGPDVGARGGGPAPVAWGGGGGSGGAGEVGGADLGAEAGEVELLLVTEQAPLLLPRQLLVHPLVLPLGQPARERPWASPHRSGRSGGDDDGDGGGEGA